MLLHWPAESSRRRYATTPFMEWWTCRVQNPDIRTTSGSGRGGTRRGGATNRFHHTWSDVLPRQPIERLASRAISERLEGATMSLNIYASHRHKLAVWSCGISTETTSPEHEPDADAGTGVVLLPPAPPAGPPNGPQPVISPPPAARSRRRWQLSIFGAKIRLKMTIGPVLARCSRFERLLVSPSMLYSYQHIFFFLNGIVNTARHYFLNERSKEQIYC